MDKGLDIGGRRALLALHPALYGPAARRLAAAFRAHRDGADDRPLNERLRAAGAAPDWHYSERALRWAELEGHTIILVGDAAYPPLLNTLAVPPPVLFVRGRARLLRSSQIAIVGSRKASPVGRSFAQRTAAELGERGWCITSGLALGIDGAAHRGALEAAAATVAVQGCGIDRTYPRRHEALSAEIAEKGALVSEFPLGAAPLRQHFPIRNRVISGLALGTLVVEAASRSGSISTALHALEQGRDVFAVPGSVNNPLARGCHALIKQGAKLVECTTDVLEDMPEDCLPAPVNPTAGTGSGAAGADGVPLEPGAAALLEACSWEPFTVDEIVRRSGLTAQNVSSMLLALELAGRVAAQAAGTYIRVR